MLHVRSGHAAGVSGLRRLLAEQSLARGESSALAALRQAMTDIGRNRPGERLFAMPVHLIVRGKPVDAFGDSRGRERGQCLAGALMDSR